jgi:hypothetical protein
MMIFHRTRISPITGIGAPVGGWCLVEKKWASTRNGVSPDETTGGSWVVSTSFAAWLSLAFCLEN